MALLPCKPRSKSAGERAEALSTVFKRWDDNQTISALTQGDTKYWKTFYETVTHKDFDYGSMPTSQQIRKLDIKMNRMIKGLKKNPSKFADWLYLPENVLSKNLLTKKYFDSMIITGNFYRGNMEMFTSDIDVMAKMIREAAMVDGAMRRFNLNRKSAQKQIQNMEAEYKQKLVEDPNEAERYYRDHLEKMAATEEQKIVQGVYDLITSPEKLFIGKGDPGSLYKKYGTASVQIARIWTGGKDSGAYTLKNGKKAGMRDKLYEVLEDGLTVYTDVMKDHAVRTGTLNETEAKLARVLEQFKAQDNFYPTQALNIFPTLNKMSELIYDSNNSKELESSLPDINRMLDSIVSDLKLDPHTFLSRGDVERRSKDVITVIDQYAKDVVRFNFTANATRNITKGLQELTRMEGTELETQAEFLSKYMKETHSTAVGLRYKDSKQAFFAKAITSWEFFNKIGLSVGTPTRNATQSLQNFVYFGAKAWRDASVYSKSKGLGDQMKTEMEKHGVFFVNLEEIAQTGDMLESIQLVDGKVVRNEPGFSGWFTSSVEKLAKTTGKPMQWVENKVNRAVTFKIAYSKMHQDLSNNDGLIRRRMEGKIPEGVSIETSVANEINNRSSRFAANMVKELHYEYSPFAKPRILQTTAGSVLGQFSTYGINFFEYNRKIAVDAGDSILAGDWNSPEAARAVRLASMYFLVDAVLEPLTNAKWSNLIQHDTKDRLEQLFDYMTGDKSEKKRTFFGKGPVIGTFGGPFVNDLFKLGNVIGFTKLSDNELINYMQGYQQKAKDVKDSRMQDAVSLLNLNLSRMIFSSMPKMRDGTGFMTILGQDYLGLWNTREIAEKREKMMLYPQNYGPQILKPYFETAKQKKEKAEKLRTFREQLAPSKVKRKPVVDTRDILESLDMIDIWGR